MSEIPIFKFALRDDLDPSFLPTKGEPKATGWDVRAAQRDKKPMIIRPFDVVKISLGLRGFCPESWWYEIKPRSSIFAKKNLHALYGTIDETYEGELVFACQYLPPVVYRVDTEMYYEQESWEEYCTGNELQIEFGDAIGQLIPRQRQEMVVQAITNEDYDNACKARAAVRGAGGFGSTGR